MTYRERGVYIVAMVWIYDIAKFAEFVLEVDGSNLGIVEMSVCVDSHGLIS